MAKSLKKKKKQKLQITSESARRLVKALLAGWRVESLSYKKPPGQCIIAIAPPTTHAASKIVSAKAEPNEDWLGALLDATGVPKPNQFLEKNYVVRNPGP